MPGQSATGVAAASHAPATHTANGLFATADDIQRALTTIEQAQAAVGTQQQHQTAQQDDMQQTTEQSAPILEPSTSKSQHIRPTGDVCDRWHNPKLELSCLSTHLVHDGCAAAEGAEKGDSAVLQPGQLEVLQGGQHSAVVQPGQLEVLTLQGGTHDRDWLRSNDR
jgi:hypothetical protein